MTSYNALLGELNCEKAENPPLRAGVNFSGTKIPYDVIPIIGVGHIGIGNVTEAQFNCVSCSPL